MLLVLHKGPTKCRALYIIVFVLLYFFGCLWPLEAAILFGSCIGPGHDNKLHPHRVLALYDLVVDGPLSNHSIQFNVRGRTILN
jgi:hypothetical protein